MSAVTHMTLYYNVTTSFEIFEVNVSARKVNGHVHMCAKAITLVSGNYMIF
jgi:hypothetical protein